MIISIDVGIKNMGVCIFTKSKEIYKWILLDLTEGQNSKTMSMIDIAKSLKNELDELLDEIELTEVIIENQLGLNAIRMKQVQALLTQYFINNNIENITYVSSQNKLKGYGRMKYSERKKKVVKICEDTLEGEWYDFFKSLNKTKRDDYADCYLQAHF